MAARRVKILILAIVLIAGLISGIVYAVVQDSDQCTASGGHEVVVSYTLVGKVLVPNVNCEH